MLEAQRIQDSVSVGLHFMKQFMSTVRCFKMDYDIATFSERKHQQNFSIGKSRLEQLKFYSVLIIHSEYFLEKEI